MSSTNIVGTIRNLTKRQRDVLDQIACGCDGGHHPNTLSSLVRLGLIESYPETLGGFPPITITRYAVPMHVHIVWAGLCSEECKE